MEGCVTIEAFEKVIETIRLVLTHDNNIVAGVVLHKETDATARQQDSH